MTVENVEDVQLEGDVYPDGKFMKNQTPYNVNISCEMHQNQRWRIYSVLNSLRRKLKQLSGKIFCFLFLITLFISGYLMKQGKDS
jgi:hypothetical protein